MSDRETLLRQWQMLRLIPRLPFKITANQLFDKLQAESFVTTKRTVERDLMTLSKSFPIISDERDKPYGWSWSKDGAVFDLPGISNTEALTFKLVEQHLKPILPASTLAQLQAYFLTADKKLTSLSSHSTAHTWLDKVRVIQPSQTLLPPDINEEAQRVISEGLLQDMQVRVTYQKRGKDKSDEYVVHPLGLVERGQLIYLVCTFSNYQDVRILALHRMLSAELHDEPSQRPVEFSLDAYITSGAFGFGGEETITLEAIFMNPAGDHLYETPLSTDQVLEPQANGLLKVTATVVNTEQLRWWLLGFGGRVEVLGPSQLREAIAQSVQSAADIYRPDCVSRE
jgi:predicted DNA-binding transcriptional regulator YafY